MSAHDRHLAGYRQDRADVKCDTCREEHTVTICTEYGQSWLEPEEHRCSDGRVGSWLQVGDPRWEDDEEEECGCAA